MPETVHVIDDDAGVRDSLCGLLEAKGYAARGHASPEQFLAGLPAEDALCVVADLRMPGMGGLELQTHLLEKSINLPFIVITGYGDVSSAVQAMKSGAADFIEKPIDNQAFLAAVERAAAARRSALGAASAAALARQKLAALTPREIEVLRLLVNGGANKIIAHELGISVRTVENHRARLMEKMKADSVAVLVQTYLAADTPPAVGAAAPGTPDMIVPRRSIPVSR